MKKKPWHKPDFIIGLDAASNPGSISLNLEQDLTLLATGGLRITTQPDGMKKLKPVFDANLNLNYNYSKALTVFADFYNLAERSYMIWNQYPSQRFNFLFGFSYKL